MKPDIRQIKPDIRQIKPDIRQIDLDIRANYICFQDRNVSAVLLFWNDTRSVH